MVPGRVTESFPAPKEETVQNDCGLSVNKYGQTEYETVINCHELKIRSQGG